MVAKLTEEEKIVNALRSEQHFLLSGGAGSGKTYSLVKTIEQVLEKYPEAYIACITYTRVAVQEIKERFKHDRLQVSTIHGFLWDCIRHYQKELKERVLALVNDDEVKLFKKPNKDDAEYENEFPDGIRYIGNYASIRKGFIEHDQVIHLAMDMFEHYPKLVNIIKDRYQFIFIDEYQDTFPETIKLLLEYFKPEEKRRAKKTILGFFGDSMQSIYDEGVGNINEYIDSGLVLKIPKEQNRRNPQKVIDLANKIRTDDLQQAPSDDKDAPNMVNGVVKEGSAIFLWSSSELPIDKIKQHEVFEEWDFNNAEQTKELWLTKKLIADAAGFKGLISIYADDSFVKFINDIQALNKEKELIEDTVTLEQFVDKYDKTLTRGDNKGKTRKEVFVESYSAIYEKYKDQPYSKIKKIQYIDVEHLLGGKKNEDDNDYEMDALIEYLYDIYYLVDLYQTKQYNQFIRKQAQNKKIKTVQDKKELAQVIKTLSDMVDHKTIGEVLAFIEETNFYAKLDKVQAFIAANDYLYKRVITQQFIEIKYLYFYLNSKTPFSTQHGVKGAEFSNVLLILDNGKWNKYNFSKVFTTPDDGREQKLFYVCCTRAKDNLVVFYNEPTEEILAKACKLFGEQNVKQLIL